MYRETIIINSGRLRGLLLSATSSLGEFEPACRLGTELLGATLWKLR